MVNIDCKKTANEVFSPALLTPSNLPIYLLGSLVIIFGIIILGFVSGWATGTIPATDDEGLINADWMLGRPDWKDNLFAWHPVMMTSYFVCQLFAFSTWAMLGTSIDRSYTKLLHTVFHLAGTATLITGMIAVVTFMTPKDLTEEVASVNSLHEYTGIIALSVFGINFFLGTTMGVYTHLTDAETHSRLSFFGNGMLLTHRIVGLTSIVFSAAAIMTGSQQYLEGGVCEATYNPEDGERAC